MSLWLLVFASLVSGAPAPQKTPLNPRQNSNPTPTSNACAQIAPMTAGFLEASPNATPRVPAALAHECLQSVPNKPEPAGKMIDSLQAFVQWQSTLVYLNTPPSSYMLPATDIVGRLNNAKTKALAGGFASEYDFQLEVVKTFLSAHDGHFVYRPDMFGFRNNLAADIVSVSVDGKSVPKLYHLRDLNNTALNSTANSTAMPAAITKINGEDASKIIEETNLAFSVFQDPDSQWNANFRTVASPENRLVVAASLAFQGESVTLTYDNGTTKTENSFANLRAGANFTGVNNGEDFYSRFCNPDAVQLNATNGTTPAKLPPPQPTIQGFPFPVTRDSGANTTSGYFLNGTGYDDVAVLTVSSFAPPATYDPVEYLTNFQSTVGDFLTKSKTAGKKKLVVDLTSNGGGLVIAGFELFSQLFPDANKFQADNIRLAESVGQISHIIGAIPKDFRPNNTEQSRALKSLQDSAIVGNLVPGSVFSPAGNNLTNVESILGPISLNGDTFTAFQSTPLNNTDPQFNLTGVGTKANPPPSVFTPENVVLLTDGTCGSTCTIFSYLMIQQRNIKTAVVGGRPNLGAMQSIAGVEGAQLKKGQLGVLAEGYILKRATVPMQAGAVNGKNAFAPSDSQTPLQFSMQPANCRFFYTAQMITKPEMVWQRAVDVTWKDPAGLCVEGSQLAINETTAAIDPLFQKMMVMDADKISLSGAATSNLQVSRRTGMATLLTALAAVMALL
ncbi:peptidase S41 family protein [Pseudomassariella vexata]|uniref:Peptidase S41 family protein n=1 Tax=Pseudomassariella vexata TaxID=1141098 RepID=A0A1Y2E3C1_9PEZI|nr:peptidase S41 family protein [Pseudomassariella vexata]ORY66048.1 peptidase S41 family protein [Pseudomassariella vexata]